MKASTTGENRKSSRSAPCSGRITLSPQFVQSRSRICCSITRLGSLVVSNVPSAVSRSGRVNVLGIVVDPYCAWRSTVKVRTVLRLVEDDIAVGDVSDLVPHLVVGSVHRDVE